jgi:hypothetical protein
MWPGEGLQQIVAALPAEVRERTAGLQPLPEWLPVEDLIAWHVAVKGGPGQDDTAFKQHVHATIDQGFGKVKRLLLSLATPHTLAPRAAALWRDEYSSGHLRAHAIDKRCVALTLRDHPYVHHPLMRSVISEAYRYIVSLTSARIVTAEIAGRTDELTIRMRWT